VFWLGRERTSAFDFDFFFCKVSTRYAILKAVNCIISGKVSVNLKMTHVGSKSKYALEYCLLILNDCEEFC
jgi:hypothetical protein